MLEPKRNPNWRLLVDPPGIVRHVVKWAVDAVINPEKLQSRRNKIEAARVKAGAPHTVEYFHQLDDPYSYLAAQTLSTFAGRYEIKLVPHLIRASGGRNQPEVGKLARWARRDAELIVPYLGLDFPASAPVRPSETVLSAGHRVLGALSGAAMLEILPRVSKAVWSDEAPRSEAEVSDDKVNALLDAGSTRQAELGHYSGATFYYGGEWYWGVDRLFHLERRLRALGACKDPDLPLICPRPPIDVAGVDASELDLDFYPSLNSPYTAIIYDKTIEMAKSCGVRFHHKPVLPMVMRGLPVPRAKGMYIVYDTKREAQDLQVHFWPSDGAGWRTRTPDLFAFALGPREGARYGAFVVRAASGLGKRGWAASTRRAASGGREGGAFLGGSKETPGSRRLENDHCRQPKRDGGRTGPVGRAKLPPEKPRLGGSVCLGAGPAMAGGRRDQKARPDTQLIKALPC